MKTKVMPKELVVLGSTVEHIITQLVCGPWVTVTEEENLSNSQSIDSYEVTKAVNNNLDQLLGPKSLVGGLEIGSHILKSWHNNKDLVAMKDPLVISTIPQAIFEGILIVYKGINKTKLELRIEKASADRMKELLSPPPSPWSS
ncbi:hypothetical protein DPEC_G00125510 [Dallia pectoralis]|uniref:Uncharacterized protein n=1 Tax=Dallia pectoralis TaxID=75939 RepID=A0ACC2GRW3_DALPE|nr:hypothetical protein DPEC_G00125510 [Dallia pectoralis]